MLPEQLDRLARLVRDIADRELPAHFHCDCGERKADGSLVTASDIRMQAALGEALAAQWPGIPLLGEEMEEPLQRATLDQRAGGLWCVDPLDGTTNFAIGVPYYAVSVALIQGERVELAVVYDPSRCECFAAARGQGAWRNQERLGVPGHRVPLDQGLALIDLKRLDPALAARLAAEPPYKSQRSFGAVALDWCWLAAGRCQVYLHGRQKLWDYAAGCLILEEAGGQALTLEGEPVFKPTLEPRSSAAALDAEVFRQWTDWLGIPRRGSAAPGLS
ncbi:MAG TPA: inositol monophosphatase family protein [Gammaproteobacteria bacterium]|nr:inositol monophosphatase family protein [Gammaproteobacteria bacterium]